ncbi:hypothetical protein FKX85_06605 [Echinicola soli]|uniref:Uncharacterized protein n=1 Tax=Echinicola soli TaxID=2591634 RepID=A0A514CFX8_9BACT|nr:hypothetical protein [Echinicola soli]QDH78723.1 hypothetical protein FKX85_06605 [Echinicola soli]
MDKHGPIYMAMVSAYLENGLLYLLQPFRNRVKEVIPQGYKLFDGPIIIAGHQKEIHTLFNTERGRFNRIYGTGL